MPPHNERDFATPRIDEAGPAGVDSDIFTIAGTEADGRVVKGLASVLKNWERGRKGTTEQPSSESTTADDQKRSRSLYLTTLFPF